MPTTTRPLPILWSSLPLLLIACGGPVPLSPPVTMTLHNALTHSIFVERAACGASTWATVLDHDGHPLDTQTGACSNVCGEPLVECAALCVAPQVDEIKPGESRSVTWDGMFVKTDQSNHCNEKFAASGQLSVSFCFGDTVTAQPSVQNPRCQQVPLIVHSGAVVEAEATP